MSSIDTAGRNYATVILCIHRVSKKTSHLWLAITLTRMNGFWYFLAEMILIK